MKKVRKIYNTAGDVFFADHLGFFTPQGQGRKIGFLSVLGKRSTLNRLLVSMHHGDTIMVDNGSYGTFAKGYRVFRRPFAQDLYHAVVVPTGMIVQEKVDALVSDAEDENTDPKSAKGSGPANNLDSYPPVRAVFLSSPTDLQERIWTRLQRLSPIPLLATWRDPIMDILSQPDYVINRIRIDQGLTAIPGNRLLTLQDDPLLDPSPYAGVLLDIPVSDLAAIGQQLLTSGEITFH